MYRCLDIVKGDCKEPKVEKNNRNRYRPIVNFLTSKLLVFRSLFTHYRSDALSKSASLIACEHYPLDFTPVDVTRSFYGTIPNVKLLKFWHVCIFHLFSLVSANSLMALAITLCHLPYDVPNTIINNLSYLQDVQLQPVMY